jgi:AraC-like DNA-binding protein
MSLHSEEPIQEEDPLADALDKGIYLNGVYDDGRMSVIMSAPALDALCKILQARQRHMPVSQDAVEMLTYWQQHLCNARVFWNERCRYFVDGPGQRCPQHKAIDRVHPDAEPIIEQLGPRARQLFDQAISDVHVRNAWRLETLAQRVGQSPSSVHRAIKELDAACLAWRPRRRPIELHPALVFLGHARQQQEAIAKLRADRRAAFRHLEPVEDEETNASAA